MCTEDGGESASSPIFACLRFVRGRSRSPCEFRIRGFTGQKAKCRPVLRTILELQCLLTFLRDIFLIFSCYTAKKACRFLPVMETRGFQLSGQVETNTRALAQPTSEPSVVLENDTHNSHHIRWWVFCEFFPFFLLNFVLAFIFCKKLAFPSS